MKSKKTDFDDLLTHAINTKIFPGCSIIYIDTKETFTQSYGHFTYDKQATKVTLGTVYDCASLTKIIAPMSVAMMLIDEKKLDLNQKVGFYLPEFLNQAEKETALLSHLMTYTLDYNIPGGSKSIMGTLTPEQVVKNTFSYHLKAEPGSGYMYSNITAFLLTQIIERVTGRDFADLVAERVFTPLGMNSATLSPARSDVCNIPPTEITDDRGEVRGFVHDEFTYFTTKGGFANGAAGLFASIEDIGQFLHMTLQQDEYTGHKLFSDSIVSQWTEDYYPALLPTHTPLGWGDLNNVLIDKYHRHLVVKSGFTGCFMAADLANKKAIAILSNRIYPRRPADASAFGIVKEKLLDIAMA